MAYLAEPREGDAGPAPARDLRASSRVAIAGSGLVAAFVVTAKSVRDTLACTTFELAELPGVMAGGAAATVLLALATAWLFRARGPAFGIVALLIANAAALAAEQFASRRAPLATALLLYFHVSAVAAVVASGFWLLVNERFDPHALRALLARIGLGGSIGGLLGGALIAYEASPRLGLWVSAVLSLALVAVVRKLGARSGTERHARAARRVPGHAAYVRLVALLVGLTAVASSLADFAFKVRATENFSNPGDLVRFFALFYAGVNVLGFIVQSTITPRLLDRADLGVALSGMPAAVGFSGLLTLVFPGLGAQALLKAADGSFGPSLFRSAYEPLFTPLPVSVKRTVKALVDVAADKAGDASGSALAWASVLLVPGASLVIANLAVAVLSLATLVLAGHLYQRYVEELARSLRAGTIALSETELRDRTTRLTLSQTIDHMARERVLQEIQQRATMTQAATHLDRGQAVTIAPAPPIPCRPRASPAGAQVGLAEAVRDLTSADPECAARAMIGAEPALTAFIVPLLEHPLLAQRAATALEALGSRVSGQLADALLDREHHSPRLRRRLARVLSRSAKAWSATALLAALDDTDAGVREEVVHGLEQLRRRSSALPVSRASLLAAAQRELDRDGPDPGRQHTRHALELLGLLFEPEPFQLATKALASADEKLRGTALEYLENIVPEPVRSTLLARLSSESATMTQRIAHHEVDTRPGHSP